MADCFDWNNVLEPHLDAAARARLAAARVGIAGAGGLGSNCAMLLTRCGIGGLVLVDDDVISISNLNRQYYLPGQIGRRKVEALADNLRALNPAIRLEQHVLRMDSENIPILFKGCDIVVEALDDAAAKRMLLETMIANQRHVIAASGLAGWGGSPMTCRKLGQRAAIVGDFTRGTGENLPPLAPRVMIAAAMQADYVLEYLLGKGEGFEDQNR